MKVEKFAGDPKVYDKALSLLKDYTDELDKCDEIYDLYALYSAHLIFLDMIKAHFDFVHTTNGEENIRKLLEEACSMVSSDIVKSAEGDIFEN